MAFSKIPRLAFVALSKTTGDCGSPQPCHPALSRRLVRPTHAITDTESCVFALAEHLSSSEAAFLDNLAFTGGRYVLAYKRAEEPPSLLTDAGAMKTAYRYAVERRLVGSHMQLVADNAAHATARPRIPFKWGYAGLRTPLKNIFLLTANTKLDLDHFTVSRYWPAGPLPPMAVPDASVEAKTLMQASLAHISSFYRPVISISAGLDSRVTLALSKIFPVRYFNHCRWPPIQTDRLDREFALWVSSELGLDVHLIDRTTKAPIAFNDALARNTYYNHGRDVAFECLQTYGADKSAIHVRSNLSEIGRRFFSKKGEFKPTTSGDLSEKWISCLSVPPPSNTDIMEAFREFDDVTGLTRCPVDTGSLFYWEHRMSAWHSQIIIESDPAFDTLSLYNCRRIFEVLLSVPAEDQKRASIHKQIIRDAWPALTRPPLNGKPFERVGQTTAVSSEAEEPAVGSSKALGTARPYRG
jgi:hypothetical protein